ncbi:MAG: NAD(P)/FAD-dependent oxidoreductase [Deltaproteobacteria bacterium]|nr:NAD(P)/FAD-dependent oxidoreductase [Deltaproteobacteria bacterium]
MLNSGTPGAVRRLGSDWDLTIIDPSPAHLYQPGLLFLPFGARDDAALERPRARTLAPGASWVEQEVERLATAARRVVLAGGDTIPYDLLVIATGARLRPELTPGLVEAGARGDAHDFYTLQGAQALRAALEHFAGGRLVVNVVEVPIKCPVAPLEFLMLADEHFTRRGLRDRVELVYATPLDGAFTRPLAAALLGRLVERKGIRVETELATAEVDPEQRVLRSFDGREVAYDLLVSVPTHSGARLIEDSGMGNELGFVPTDQRTLVAKGHDGVFVLGDATDLPTSKAGSVAHFEADVLVENLSRAMRGQAPEASFDGHANCFVESGFGQALLLDFNYDVEPLPGRYPLPGIGPFSLLEESRTNHLGKLAFRWLYWNALLPGRPLPVSAQFSLSGKRRPPLEAAAST